MMPEGKRKPPNAQQSTPTDQNRKIQSPTRTRETFLFEQQLDSNDVERRQIRIPWEKAEKHFPPHTGLNFSHEVLVSDTRNESWTMRISDHRLKRQYGIEVGWPKFATKYNLEAMDVVRFYRPLNPNPSQKYHYLIECRKSTEGNTRRNEKKAEGIVIGKQKQTEVVHQKEPGKTDMKFNGYALKFLFQKELTRADVTQKFLRIPIEEAEKHFPPLVKKPDGSHKEEGIMVCDPRGWWRWMKIRFSGFLVGYVIAGEDWSEYVSKHELHQKDVIRFFKVVKHVPAGDKHYYVDYLRAKEAVETNVSPSGKGGGSKKRGGGEGIGGGGSGVGDGGGNGKTPIGSQIWKRKARNSSG
ncbi:hypothetical protein RHGRI_035999 [Rhododendron griersonianum]|uniref:TF-B3 domain-containing protein n=1 Tax=Rhododendron griersonianum TaxID=479676 RepID=A0AAV6HLT0_9ERIC|nr:hypothetical protein RHGRI_035999 [Rhododendron griersonianum]